MTTKLKAIAAALLAAGAIGACGEERNHNAQTKTSGEATPTPTPDGGGGS